MSSSWICGRWSWSWMTPANQRWSHPEARVPDDNTDRIERDLVALDMAKRLYKSLRMSSCCCSWWMDWSAWQVDQVWHHTKIHDCSSPESFLWKAFKLEVVEHSCYATFRSEVSSDEPCDSELNSLCCVNVGLVDMFPNGWHILQLWTNQAFVTGGSDLAGAGWQIPPKESNCVVFFCYRICVMAPRS